MVRLIDIRDATIGTWGAIAELMNRKMHDGQFEDTVIILRWNQSTPSVALGCYQDADQLDAGLVRERGGVAGRLYGTYGASTGVFTEGIPLVLTYYEHDPYDPDDNTHLYHFDEVNGAANAAAMERIGLDAEYRSIGDTEVLLDGTRHKVIASAAANFPQSTYWLGISSIIFGPPPKEHATLLDETTSHPQEKFEDKETSSPSARMQPISLLCEELDEEVTEAEVVNAVVEENVERAIGSDVDVEPNGLTDDERAFVDRMGPFFESDTWIDRVSTSGLCQQATGDQEVGVAAFKSRKLVKSSIVLDDDGYIDQAQYFGDFYYRPAPGVTSTLALEECSRAIVGRDPTDEKSLENAVRTVLDRPQVEFPALEPRDFVRPVIRAAENTRTVDEYLTEK